MTSITTKVWTTVPDSKLVDRGLKVEVTSATGMSAAVFIWQRSAPMSDGSNGEDLFVGVATPSDLAEVPETTPDILNEMPYYRTSEVELWFRNDADFLRYRDLIQRHINDLVDKLNALEQLVPQETVTYPPEAEATVMSVFHCPRCPYAVKDFVKICPTCPFVEAVRAKQG